MPEGERSSGESSPPRASTYGRVQALLAMACPHPLGCQSSPRKGCPRIHARGERKRHFAMTVLRTGFATCAAATISSRPHGWSWATEAMKSGPPCRWRSSLQQRLAAVSWQRRTARNEERETARPRWHPRVASCCRTRWNRISPLPKGQFPHPTREGVSGGKPRVLSRGHEEHRLDPAEKATQSRRHPILMGIGETSKGR